jgi:membrane protease YdiL (CAAX protease family)
MLVVEQSPARSNRIGWPLVTALLVALIVRPLFYTLLDHPFRRVGLVHGPPSRLSSWWLFQFWILFWEMLCFSFVWWALRRSGRSWSAVGLDARFFIRHAVAFLALFGFLVTGALLSPSFLYGGRLAAVCQSFGLPVTRLERLFWLVISVSAGLSEEVCYRGLPLRILARSANGAWLVLPVTMLAFVFVHGRYGARHPLPYLAFGLVFGATFILLGRRHLEWLIIAHALIDGLGVFVP